MTDTIPRLMLAALTEHADVRSMTLALAAALGRNGYQPQVYRTVAFVEASDCMKPLFGLATRHLDLWILGPQRCREILARTATLVDIALIESCPDAAEPEQDFDLALALDCPVLGVVRAEDVLDPDQPVRLPAQVPLDGVLVDGLSPTLLPELERLVPLRCRSPVVGGLDSSCLKPDGTHPDSVRRLQNLATLLSQSFLDFTDLDRLVTLASSRPFPFAKLTFQPIEGTRRPRVAVAWDDTFCRYLPDALDEFEAAGAEVVDFAPARCEALPADVDMIWIGAGELSSPYLDRYSNNHCIQSDLQALACQGKVIYAEGAGAALLCEAVHMADGAHWSMAGILPATLVQREPPPGLTPVEFKPTANRWLFRSDRTYRGYRSRHWRLEPNQDADVLATCPHTGEPLLICRKNCIASAVHLNFAAMPDLLRQALHRDLSQQNL